MRMSLSVEPPPSITLQDPAYRGPNSGRLDSQQQSRAKPATRTEKSSSMNIRAPVSSETGSPSRMQLPVPPESPRDSPTRDPLREGQMGMAALLPGIQHWQHSEEGLTEALRLRTEAIRLRTEQERTRQESLRLESRKKIMEILETALRAGVPGASIPFIFGEPSLPPMAVQTTGAPGPAGMVSPSPLISGPSPPISQNQTNIASEPGKDVRSPVSLPRYRGHHRGQSTPSFPVAFSTTAGSAQRRPVTQNAFPPPQRRPPTPGFQGASSSNDLQIHQWKPSGQQATQPHTRERSSSSPKRDFGTTSSGERPPKLPAVTQASPPQPHPQPQVTAASPQHSPAQVVANQNQMRRRMGHARHRSDITDLRGFHVPDDGVKILANAASERSKHDSGHVMERSQVLASQISHSPPPVQPVQHNKGNMFPGMPFMPQLPGQPEMVMNFQTQSQQPYHSSVQPPPPYADHSHAEQKKK